MKKGLSLLTLILLAAVSLAAANNCTTVQSGLLLYSAGHFLAGTPISPGVNPYGYNYQARSFSGSFFNAYAGTDGLPPYDGDDAIYLAANPAAAGHWAWPYRGIDLAMKWNEAWLGNQDCDFDGKLDRHFGYASYVGSGAWLTNHDSWTTMVGAKEFKATDFIKIVAYPADSVISTPPGLFGEGTVYTPTGKVIGDRLWGEFVVIQYIVNDKGSGARGVLLKSQVAAGLGKFQP